MSTASPTSSLAYASPDNESVEPLYLGLTLSGWIKIVSVTVLFVATFFNSNLVRLWNKTNPFYGEPNWGHSMCIPLIGLYYLYIHRDELLKARARTAWSGMLVLVGGLVVFAYGIWPGQNDFVKDFGMVVTLFGVVLLLCGWDVMKIAWFPIVFLVCAIPWPGLVYSWLAGPLQQLAAKVAVIVLQVTGVESISSGTKIVIAGSGGAIRTLNVAEACAGLRSLMTFVSVAAAVAFLSSRPMWQKIMMTVMAVPIAIFCNVMRVAGQGLLDHYVSQKLSESFAHQFVGMIMLIPAFFLILGVGWILDHLFIEEVDDEDLLAAKEKAKPKKLAAAVPAEAPVMPAPRVAAATKPVMKPATPMVAKPPPPPRTSVAPRAVQQTKSPQQPPPLPQKQNPPRSGGLGPQGGQKR